MQAALLKTTMKKQIILLASLFVLSFQALANDEYFEPIPCELEEGRALVDAMVAEESLPAWKESFKAAGTKVKTKLDGILNNTNNAASKTPAGEVRFLLKKAACIREVATGMNVSDEFMAKFKAYEKEIAFKGGQNFLKMPGDPQTDNEKNLVNNFRQVYFNRDVYAFLRVLIE